MSNAVAGFVRTPRNEAVVRPQAVSISVASGALLLAAAVFFTNANLRPHVDGEKFSIDFEDLLRLAICGASGIYGFVRLPRTLPYFARSAGLWGLAFCVWAALTVPLAEGLMHSLACTIALICMFLFAPAALLELGRERIVKVVYVTLIIYLLASWAAYFAWPELGRSEFHLSQKETKYRVGGLGGAQQLGLMAAWLIGAALILKTEMGFSSRRVLWPVLLAVVTLPFTESRTSMLVALAVGMLFVWRRVSQAAVLVGGCAIAVLACLGLFAFQSGLVKLDSAGLDQSLQKVSRSGKIEEIYNLTGRTEVWDFVTSEIVRSPLIGYGYGCSRYVLAHYPGSSSDNFQPRHAHNLWLDVAVATGLVGVFLYGGMVLQQIVGFFRAPNAFPDMALIIVLVAGNTEPILFGTMPKTHTVLWLIALFWRRFAAAESQASFGREAVRP